MTPSRTPKQASEHQLGANILNQLTAIFGRINTVSASDYSDYWTLQARFSISSKEEEEPVNRCSIVGQFALTVQLIVAHTVRQAYYQMMASFRPIKDDGRWLDEPIKGYLAGIRWTNDQMKGEMHPMAQWQQISSIAAREANTALFRVHPSNIGLIIGVCKLPASHFLHTFLNWRL